MLNDPTSSPTGTRERASGAMRHDTAPFATSSPARVATRTAVDSYARRIPDAATPAAKFLEIRRIACRISLASLPVPAQDLTSSPQAPPLATLGRTRSPSPERPGSFLRAPPLIDCRTRRPADAHTAAAQLPRSGIAPGLLGISRRARRLTSPTGLVGPINRLGVATAYASAVCACGRDRRVSGAAAHDPAAQRSR